MVHEERTFPLKHALNIQLSLIFLLESYQKQSFGRSKLAQVPKVSTSLKCSWVISMLKCLKSKWKVQMGNLNMHIFLPLCCSALLKLPFIWVNATVYRYFSILLPEFRLKLFLCAVLWMKGLSRIFLVLVLMFPHETEASSLTITSRECGRSHLANLTQHYIWPDCWLPWF